MSQLPPHVTDGEWAVLECLWNQGPATVRQMVEQLYPGGGPSEYATVHKFLERLQGKNYVSRSRLRGVFVFQPLIERDDLIGQELAALVEKMCGGSLQPLLTNLVRVKKLSSQELRELLHLVDSLDAKNPAKKRTRRE